MERQLVRFYDCWPTTILNSQVVAEGVETAEARDCLLEMGCDEAQGHLYGRPMTADSFTWFGRIFVPQGEMLRIARLHRCYLTLRQG
jgi:predicted signal transduction protein with EAL and GGDEF domain